MSVMPRQSVIRVLIVDDHSLVRSGLSALLEGQVDIQVCGEAASAAEALAMMKQFPAQVAIVDLSLKEGNGLQLIKDLKNRHPEIRIVVSSMHEEATYAERALQAGAKAYVQKSEDSQRIIDAIRSVMADRIFVSDQISDKLLKKAVHGSQSAGRSSIELLTDRELQVFEMVGDGMSTGMIAEKLHLSPKTIDTYRQKIREKLHLENAAALNHFAAQWALKERESASRNLPPED